MESRWRKALADCVFHAVAVVIPGEMVSLVGNHTCHTSHTLNCAALRLARHGNWAGKRIRRCAAVCGDTFGPVRPVPPAEFVPARRVGMPAASSGIGLSVSYQRLGWGGVRCTVGQGNAAAQPDSARQVQAALAFGDVDARDCERSQGRAACRSQFW